MWKMRRLAMAPLLLKTAYRSRLMIAAMKPLEPPDTHYLSAAIGWLELGNVAEAEADLNRVSAGHQCHPDVLEVRWIILAQGKRWDSALEIARALLDRKSTRLNSSHLGISY